MLKAKVCLLVALSAFFIIATVSAREIDKRGLRLMKSLHENENQEFIDQGARGLVTASAVDSYCLVWYDFETMNWQGWTTLDNTADIDTFFHVDDFAGLGGGDYGGLYALEGTKSMWCGTRPAEDARAKAAFWYLCGWSDSPGYGNKWRQMLTTGAFPIAGMLTFSYKGYFDSEPDYDQTFVEYDRGDGVWEELAMYGGQVDTVATHTMPLSQVATKLRFHFVSDGAWSDQDGLWDTDGACIIDDILVVDGTGQINAEDWEGESLDALSSDDGFWVATTEDAYGSFAGLASGLIDKDPCGDNIGAQVVFFQGSSYPSADYPGLFDTPFCAGPFGNHPPCQNESVMSPIIEVDMYSSNRDEVQDTAIPSAVLPNLGGTVLRFCVYRDLPLLNFVFYTWSIRSIVDGCPGQWMDRNYVYYGGDKDYIQVSQDVSDLVGVNSLQVVVSIIDMCGDWGGWIGCSTHTPSPWFDSVRLYKYDTSGPQWSHRDLDIFQDNFPSEEFNIESWVRIDAANDLRANGDPVIDPGDSAVVTCSAPLAGGLDTLVTGEEQVYCHVWGEYVGYDLAKPDLFGPTLEGTYGTYVSDDGFQWTIFHMPTAITGAGNEAEGKYMIDLNDSLFTRGYMVHYYFKAFDFDGASSTLPADAETDGNIFEVTCLPSLNSGTLYVDDFHGRGTFDGTVQTYFDPAFAAVLPGSMPDRYDVNSPSSLVSNGPGSRAYNFQMNTYEKVVWDSGNLNSGTITEGSDYSDKSNDCQLLLDWMNLSEHKVRLWVLGDDVAADLDGSFASSALGLLNACGVDHVNDSYYELTGGRVAGGVVTPLVTGVGIYAGISYYAFAGCPIINGFDVLEITGTGTYSLQLPDYLGTQYYMGVSNSQLNSVGQSMRTSWVGHSLMYIRNGDGATLDRNALVCATWEFFGGAVQEDITGDDPVAKYALIQNYPNPFNPNTTIRFNLKAKGQVSLKIYNVAGQLVRSLTNEVWEAGSHTIDWNGRNDLGSSVASGVYFYRIEAGEFESTRKMVLLR
ncbi:MAG: T9SS type A sorting domain-containing protein [Candidatus Krumholzibacteria bacterium]|nr:T9SS type A sorting domain-containing protein [Candidatus Krumholzibacteria bacterium]